MNVQTEESATRGERIDLNRVDSTPETFISGRFWTLNRPRMTKKIAVRGQSPPTPPERLNAGKRSW